jgi:hypothetical protein
LAPKDLFCTKGTSSAQDCILISANLLWVFFVKAPTKSSS